MQFDSSFSKIRERTSLLLLLVEHLSMKLKQTTSPDSRSLSMMAASPFRTVRWRDDEIYKILSLQAVWISVRLRGPIPDIFAEHTAISWKMDEIEETVLPLPRRLRQRKLCSQ